MICKELYREVRGKYPEAMVFVKRPADVGLWLKTAGKIADNIIVMYENILNKLLKGEELEGEKLAGLLERRFKEAFSQGLGFLILIASQIDKVREKVEELCSPYTPRILDIHVTSSGEEVAMRLKRFLNALFGIPPYEEERPEFIDKLISGLDRDYRSFVNELLPSEYVAYVKRSPSERESEDHVAMKVLTVKHLCEELNVQLKDVSCEKEVDVGVVADVYVENKALAIECETLLGTAPAPLLKIFETVRKYANAKDVKDVWVVIRNWPAALHLGNLYWAEKLLQKELSQHGKNVKFFVPNIYQKTLTPLDEIVTKVYA